MTRTRIVALIYWVFKTDKKQTTPYLSTCLFIGLICILNLVSLMLIFRIPKSTFTITLVESKKLNSCLNTLIITTPLLFGFYAIFPQKKLDSYYFSDEKIKKDKKKLLIYFFTSLLLLVIFLIRFGIERKILFQ